MTQIYLVPLPTDALLHCQDALLFCWDTLLFCPDTLLFGQDLPLFFVTSLLKYRCTCGAYNSLFAPWREPGLSPSSSALILNEAQSYYDTKAGSNLEAPVKGGRTEAWPWTARVMPEHHNSLTCCHLKKGKTRYCLWKTAPEWTKRYKNGQNFSRCGPKKYIHYWQGSLQQPYSYYCYKEIKVELHKHKMERPRRLHIITMTRQKKGLANIQSIGDTGDTRIQRSQTCCRLTFQWPLAKTLPKTRSSTFGMFWGVSWQLKLRKRKKQLSKKKLSSCHTAAVVWILHSLAWGRMQFDLARTWNGQKWEGGCMVSQAQFDFARTRTCGRRQGQ